jgi:hypothetical protein
LNLYDNGKIDTEEIFFQESEFIKEPLSEEVCQHLIMKYFMSESEKITLSFKCIEIFIDVLADQLIRFSSNNTIKNLKLKLGETNANIADISNIRSTIVKLLLNTSKNFVIPSVKMKSDQLKSLTFNYENDIVQFVNSSNYILFFNSQNFLYILYHDKNKIPDNIRLLLKSQALDNPENCELFIILETIARRSNEKLELPKYVLTIDNLMKMSLILLRVHANIPVVICGEAGCGKAGFNYLSFCNFAIILILVRIINFIFLFRQA